MESEIFIAMMQEVRDSCLMQVYHGHVVVLGRKIRVFTIR